jgi:YVTN family beta-propeller protein
MSHRSLIALVAALASGCLLAPANEAIPLSPTDLVSSPDGKQIYVACATSDEVLVLDSGTRQISRSIKVPNAPLGLALARDGKTLYVTCAAPESTVCVVDTGKGEVTARIPAGHTTLAPVLSPDGRLLFVCNRFNNEVAFVDLATHRVLTRVSVLREPIAADITPEGRFLFVANHLPVGPANANIVAASISVIEVAASKVCREIQLPSGTTLVRGLRVSPDGRHVAVVHQLSRFHLPTTQLDRGWVNTSAVSLIDVAGLKLINTVLLDEIVRGAANPWAVAWNADGRTFYVTHAGTHDLSVVDFQALLAKLQQLDTPETSRQVAHGEVSRTAADVQNDLSFLLGLRQRIRLSGTDRGPRGLAIIGSHAWLANYFSDTLAIVDLAATGVPPQTVALAAPMELTRVRRGELLFNDASICFQGWQSCSSCHSHDARVDGLNWDNLNDGMGNPKNSKSLLDAHRTPPSMWLGVRADASIAVRAGIRNSMFTVQPAEVAEALDDYLQSLQPIPSPRLVSGALSPAARRGKELFASQAVGCANCHEGPSFTDQRFHNVGTVGKTDKPQDRFDTPSLIEIWRSGPYLHDGRAVTVKEVITSFNPSDRHGTTSHLSAREIEDLAEFVLSL